MAFRTKTNDHDHQKYQKADRAIELNYDRLSKWYDLLATHSERHTQTAGLGLLDVKEGGTVLEIGFGTGQNLLSLARSVGRSGRVWGIDLSRGMIFKARKKIRRAALSEKVVMVRGNAIYLPFASGFCNAIFMSFTLELFNSEEILMVLSECHRILGDGGMMCVVALARKANPNFPTQVYELALRKFPELIDCRPIHAQVLVSHAGFWVQNVSEMSVWGLPVNIVLAEKK